jgi:WXG100 family type VII secretion target
MANAIEFDYEKMSATVTNIQTIAEEYRTASEKFQQSFTDAIATWEGDSKDKMVQLVDESVMKYLNSLETAVNGLATLLNENAEQMKQADASIAESISNMIN